MAKKRYVAVKDAVTVRFEDDLSAGLNKLVKSKRTNKSAFIRGLVQAAVDSHQHQQAAA